MAKRRAAYQLNQDNWDKEDEPEDPGTFQRLNEDELKNRIIKKAKRYMNKEIQESSGSSPFAAFSGFSKSASGTSPFTFLKSNAEGSSSFNTLTNKDIKKENGNAATKVGNEARESEITNTKKNADSVSSDKRKPIRSIEYYRQLQSLNESVMKWMQLHLSKNSCCDFTPVFNDYKKHLDTLNVTYPVKAKEISEEKNSSCQSSASDEDSLPKNNNNNVDHGFKFGNNHKNDDETDYGAHFKSNTTNTSTFSFGISKTPTATSSISAGPTTSLRDESAPEKKSFQFSFGLKNMQGSTADSSLSKPFSFTPTEKVDDAGATDEPEYVPPKNEFVAVKEENAFYSIRCKLFFKKDDTFVERGIGTLHLKPLDGKTQLIIRADTSLGNILLNIVLSDSLPISRTGKNNVLLVCIPNPPLDFKKADSKEAIPMLIRVKTSEVADELLQTLNKHKS